MRNLSQLFPINYFRRSCTIACESNKSTSVLAPWECTYKEPIVCHGGASSVFFRRQSYRATRVARLHNPGSTLAQPGLHACTTKVAQQENTDVELGKAGSVTTNAEYAGDLGGKLFLTSHFVLGGLSRMKHVSVRERTGNCHYLGREQSFLRETQGGGHFFHTGWEFIASFLLLLPP